MAIIDQLHKLAKLNFGGEGEEKFLLIFKLFGVLISKMWCGRSKNKFEDLK